MSSFKHIIIINFIFMDPCIVDDTIEIPTKCGFVIEFIIQKSEIINSITKLNLVGISIETLESLDEP